MRRGASDRRAAARFEIVGELAGTIETLLVLSLRDAGRGGVLAESPVTMAIGSHVRVRVHCEGIQAPAEVIVRHVRQMTLSTGEQRFLVGFEFASLSPALIEILDRWMVLHGEASA